MRITVMTADENIISLEVDPHESVENVKALLEVETQVPLQQQQLLFNGKEMRNHEKLSALGVKDEDLIMMISNAASAAAVSGAGANDLGFNPDGSAVDPGAFQQQLRRDSNLMAQLFQSDPELAQVLLGNDLNRLQDLLRQRHRQRSELRRQQEEELALLDADPFDVEAQRKIEAAIRQKGIDENWAAALEYNPEAFARVVMLYVDMEVNGVPLKAFVDSGAQSTIISKSCAERCGLLRLLDQRYKGIAHGVGQSEILGRIHVAPIKIGNIFYPCSFLVLDAPNMEFLFGLDMLRKHQCIIDLKENVLRVGGGEVSVPFLQEKDIPPRFLDEERFSKEASSSRNPFTGMPIQSRFVSAKGSAELVGVILYSAVGNPVASGATATKNDVPAGGQSSGVRSGGASQGPEFEAKVAKLVELGFGREAVIQALKLFDGNEEQAAGFLFGG
ncbi:DNA damage-inducible protein 1 [Turnera subulata]|uniref:DNA damage-inducible protein 1 n=1 Tax=Turnera subulata TaxID=218843 RepID=A0A9Q0FMF1_9ROSI|nr:DNA damage-inducible protein 1 [Turnera subulata]